MARFRRACLRQPRNVIFAPLCPSLCCHRILLDVCFRDKILGEQAKQIRTEAKSIEKQHVAVNTTKWIPLEPLSTGLVCLFESIARFRLTHLPNEAKPSASLATSS